VAEWAVDEQSLSIAKTTQASNGPAIADFEVRLTVALQAQARLGVLRNWLRDYESARQREEAREGWLTRLGDVRNLLHREAAPRLVAQRNLQLIQQRVNEMLEWFDAEFRVTAVDGLSFEAHFTDGRQLPAERLSIGQQVVLALGFRFAVSFLYANLGFLVLDEPTAYLDRHHISGFKPTLERLRKYAASQGLQCVIVTHERELAPLFDAVISVGGLDTSGLTE
jgi:DNA repair exonuclease SbcCD ATPase subunit